MRLKPGDTVALMETWAREKQPLSVEWRKGWV